MYFFTNVLFCQYFFCHFLANRRFLKNVTKVTVTKVYKIINLHVYLEIYNKTFLEISLDM